MNCEKFCEILKQRTKLSKSLKSQRHLVDDFHFTAPEANTSATMATIIPAMPKPTAPFTVPCPLIYVPTPGFKCLHNFTASNAVHPRGANVLSWAHNSVARVSWAILPIP
jgi:hypothetical protein